VRIKDGQLSAVNGPFVEVQSRRRFSKPANSAAARPVDGLMRHDYPHQSCNLGVPLTTTSPGQSRGWAGAGLLTAVRLSRRVDLLTRLIYVPLGDSRLAHNRDIDSVQYCSRSSLIHRLSEAKVRTRPFRSAVGETNSRTRTSGIERCGTSGAHGTWAAPSASSSVGYIRNSA
jgi:hypothetical protein